MNFKNNLDLKLALMEAFGMPKNLISFEIRADINSPVEITCVYYPEGHPTDENGVLIKEISRYKMVKEDE